MEYRNNITPIKQPMMTMDEIALINEYRALLPECQECLRVLVSAAKEYSGGFKLDFLAHMTK